MVKGHSLEEITVAIDLAVLLIVIKLETTNSFFCSHAGGTLFRKMSEALNKNRIKMILKTQ